MADTFKSFTVDLTSTDETTLYTCPTGDDTASPKTLPTTAIVKSIFIANDQASTSSTITINIKDSSNSNFKTRLVKATMSQDSELSVIDQPIVLEAGDQVLLTAGTGNCLHAILSVLEIT